MIRQPFNKIIFVISFLFSLTIYSQNDLNKISENEIIIIRKINVINENNSDSLIYEKYFQKLVDAQFNPEYLEFEINNVLNFYENNGYPFAEVKIQSVIISSDSNKNKFADIYISIQKGELQKISKVEIEGNIKTNNNVIINELRIASDEKYSQEKIDRIPILLNKLNFFESVETPKYFVDNENNGVLKISIKEKNTNSFDGIIGYVPAQTEIGKGYLTGFVNIILRNLFGTGRGTAIKWQQESSTTQELSLKYLEPWIFNYPFNLNLEFFQRKQDSSYVKRLFGGSLEFLATENISAALILESEFVIPTLTQTTINNIPNSSSLNSGLKVKIDYRDDIFSPTKGLVFGSTYKYRQKKINSLANSELNGNINYHNYELEFGGYYSFFKSQVLSLEIDAKEIIGDYFDASDYFQFGGTNSLRGYRENSFIGNRVIWSNLEYRFLLSQRSFLFAFWDSGYFLQTNNLENSAIRQERFANGYGFGLSLETGLGIMKVSYAIAEGTSLLNGFIHFGLVNDF
ncbi:MAG: BamA/TamA family outer membrane protein [Ignavibacteriae bacterium]|nr:BamA/TamA family outer membrane protein [Ignavibacteriota bacterium]